MARVANKSEIYEDLISFLREIVKGSHENVFNHVCNHSAPNSKISFLFKNLIVKHSK